MMIKTCSMMMTISAPPTELPITEAETWEDVLSGAGDGMAAWLHIMDIIESPQFAWCIINRVLVF